MRLKNYKISIIGDAPESIKNNYNIVSPCNETDIFLVSDLSVDISKLLKPDCYVIFLNTKCPFHIIHNEIPRLEKNGARFQISFEVGVALEVNGIVHIAASNDSLKSIIVSIFKDFKIKSHQYLEMPEIQYCYEKFKEFAIRNFGIEFKKYLKIKNVKIEFDNLIEPFDVSEYLKDFEKTCKCKSILNFDNIEKLK